MRIRFQQPTPHCWSSHVSVYSWALSYDGVGISASGSDRKNIKIRFPWGWLSCSTKKKVKMFMICLRRKIFGIGSMKSERLPIKNVLDTTVLWLIAYYRSGTSWTLGRVLSIATGWSNTTATHLGWWIPRVEETRYVSGSVQPPNVVMIGNINIAMGVTGQWDRRKKPGHGRWTCRSQWH